MDLLDKFAEVEVRADGRISESDKHFCEQHQAAYQAALDAFSELVFIWNDIVKGQDDLLRELGEESYLRETYLHSSGGPAINEDTIKKHIKSLHTEFIENLVNHFNKKYHVTVETHPIEEQLLPQKPEDRWREHEADWQAYEAAMLKVRLGYQAVVDQIIVRLDGRGFMEQAFFELQRHCHKAAWNSYTQKAEYTLKKDTIVFTGYACSFEHWTYDKWELSEGMRKVIQGLAHFETGSFDICPHELSRFIGYGSVQDNVWEFDSCEKICQLKMYKNHRVDLKFSSSQYASEFASAYLGMVY